MNRVVIIHHVKPYHLDDFLAVSLLMYKHRDSDVQRITVPTNDHALTIASTLANANNTVYVLDIGGRYGKEANIYYFDHHQDTNLPSSFMLVLKELFPQHYQLLEKAPGTKRLLEIIDINDRFGPRKAEAIYSTDMEAISGVRSLLMAGAEPRPEVGEALLKMIENEARAFEETEILVFKPVVVAKAENSVPPSVVNAKKIQVLITRNSRNPNHTSIILLDDKLREKHDSEKLTRLLEEVSGKKLVFRHATNFLYVIDIPFEKVGQALAGEIAGLLAHG